MLLVATDTGCSAAIVLGTQCSIRMQLAPIDCVHEPRDVLLIFASDRRSGFRLTSHSNRHYIFFFFAQLQRSCVDLLFYRCSDWSRKKLDRWRKSEVCHGACAHSLFLNKQNTFTCTGYSWSSAGKTKNHTVIDQKTILRPFSWETSQVCSVCVFPGLTDLCLVCRHLLGNPIKAQLDSGPLALSTNWSLWRSLARCSLYQ